MQNALARLLGVPSAWLFAVLLLTWAPGLARADRLQATFRYTHDDSIINVTRPAAFMKVTVWRGPPFQAQVADVVADSNGAVDVTVANLPIGSLYFLKIFAWNTAAKVNEPAFFPGTTSEWEYATSMVALPSNRTVNWGTITFNSTDGSPLNIADVIRKGRDYAMSHRDPTEADSANIPQVRVQPYTQLTPVAPTYYQPAVPASASWLNLAFDFWQDDLTILHEYAHFLEHAISKFAPIPAGHDGCWARTNPWWPGTTPFGFVVTNGPLLNSLGHAWMEGFANYYAAAVDRWFLPNDVSGRSRGTYALSPPSVTQQPGNLEAPGYLCVAGAPAVCNACPAVGMLNTSNDVITPAMIENKVASWLWDLVDDCSVDVPCNINEPDRVRNAETEIFQIFDKEMGAVAGCPSDCPNVYHFHDAWVRRGHDDVGMDEAQEYAPIGSTPTINNDAIPSWSLTPQHVVAAIDQTNPAARLPNGGTAVMVRGVDDRLWVREQSAPGSNFGDWFGVPGVANPLNSGNTLMAGVAVAQTSGGFWVVGRMLNGALGYTVRDSNGWTPTGTQGWYSLGAPGGFATSGLPTVVEHANGRMFIFARDDNDQVWVRYQTTVGTLPGTFGAWTNLGGTARSMPVAVTTGPAYYTTHVFMRDTNLSIKRRSCSIPKSGGSCTWGSWVNMGGSATSAPTALRNAAGLAEVFFRDSTGGVQRAVETANGVFGPFAAMDTPPVQVVPNSGLATAGTSIWTRAGTVVRRKVNPSVSGEVWETLPSLPAGIISAPAVALDGAGLPLAFVEAADDAIWFSRREGGVWMPWTSLGGITKGFSASAVSGETE